MKNLKHFGIIAVLVAISTYLVYTLLTHIGLLPLEASAQARIIDKLFYTHFLVISFLFSLIVIFIAYSLIVFRRKEGEPDTGPNTRGNNALEITWTIIPLGAVLFFSYLGARSLAEVRRVDPQAMLVKVTAGQWFWRFEYPDYQITTDVLMLPVNQQVLLQMTSLDVIHSFWVPEFRVKQDVLPGKNLVKELRVTPTIIGTYTVRCSQLCGGAHAYMNSNVKVVSQADFDAWVREQSTVANDPVKRGEMKAKSTGCLGCHSLDGKPGVGPTWKGLFGKENTLSDGTKVKVDDEYLKNAILSPNSQVSAGFPPNVMPQNYASQLSDEQLSDLIAFIKSIQ